MATSQHHQQRNALLNNARKCKEAAKKRTKVKRDKAKAATAKPPTLQIRCDARTTMTIRHHMLDFWRQRYPKLTVIA